MCRNLQFSLPCLRTDRCYKWCAVSAAVLVFRSYRQKPRWYQGHSRVNSSFLTCLKTQSGSMHPSVKKWHLGIRERSYLPHHPNTPCYHGTWTTKQATAHMIGRTRFLSTCYHVHTLRTGAETRSCPSSYKGRAASTCKPPHAFLRRCASFHSYAHRDNSLVHFLVLSFPFSSLRHMGKQSRHRGLRRRHASQKHTHP